MEYKSLHLIKIGWDDMTGTVMDLEEISLTKMQFLLNETFKALISCHKSELVPKEICNIFLSVEDFINITSIIESAEKEEGFYHCLEFRIIINALREGFFSNADVYDYPRLHTSCLSPKSHKFDFEKDTLEDYFSSLKGN